MHFGRDGAVAVGQHDAAPPGSQLFVIRTAGDQHAVFFFMPITRAGSGG